MRNRWGTIVAGALVSLSASGCGGGAEAEGGSRLAMSVVDRAGVRIVEFGDPWNVSLPQWEVDAEPRVAIGTTYGTPEDQLFGANAAVMLSSGAIAVANSGTREVRLYDAEGVHLRTLGRRGSGPGEFEGMSWIGLGGRDTIVVYDVLLRRATWLSPEGGLVRTLPLDPVGEGGFPEPIGLTGTGLVMRSGFDRQFGRGERRDTMHLYRYDHLGAVGDSLASYPGRERFFYNAPDGSFAMQFTPIYGRDGFASVRGDRLVAGASDAFEIDVFDGGGLTLRIRAQPRIRPVQRDDVEVIRARLRAGIPEMFREARLAAIDELPVRETLPAFEGLRVDSERWIWIRDAARHLGDVQRWLILDPDGVPTAHLEAPRDLEVFEVGPDYLLGRERDADGVERILAYTLRRRG